MEKSVLNGMKKMHRDELEDSLDTSWLSGSIHSPGPFKPVLDLSRIFSQQSMHSNRNSLSVSQSIEDMSFFRTRLTTPRVVKASHDIQISNTNKLSTSSSFFRSTPKVVTLRKRTVPENLLLDSYPKPMRKIV